VIRITPGRRFKAQEAEHLMDNGPNETYNSDAYKNELRETRTIVQSSAQYWRCGCGVCKGGKVHEATTMFRFFWRTLRWSRCPLAEFKTNKATLWAPTQNPQAVQDIVRKSSDRERRCDLPRHASRWGIRAQVEARLVRRPRFCPKKLGRPVKVFGHGKTISKFDYYNAVGPCI